MPKLTVNDIQGFAYFQARDHIGISISKVCEMTGLNRNKLSQFEQEKGTLAANEKRTLKRFYEERGYDFHNVESIDGDTIKAEYDANKAEVTESIDSLMSNETGEALISYIDSVHDVLTVNGYLDDLSHQPTEQQPVMPELYQQLMTRIIQHFEEDKQGQFAKVTGFFGDSASGRGENVMGILAFLKLQELQSLKPDVFTLSVSQTAEQSDSRRLLKAMGTVFDYDSLSEFKDCTSKLIK